MGCVLYLCKILPGNIKKIERVARETLEKLKSYLKAFGHHMKTPCVTNKINCFLMHSIVLKVLNSAT